MTYCGAIDADLRRKREEASRHLGAQTHMRGPLERPPTQKTSPTLPLAQRVQTVLRRLPEPNAWTGGGNKGSGEEQSKATDW